MVPCSSGNVYTFVVSSVVEVVNSVVISDTVGCVVCSNGVEYDLVVVSEDDGSVLVVYSVVLSVDTGFVVVVFSNGVEYELVVLTEIGGCVIVVCSFGAVVDSVALPIVVVIVYSVIFSEVGGSVVVVCSNEVERDVIVVSEDGGSVAVVVGLVVLSKAGGCVVVVCSI